MTNKPVAFDVYEANAEFYAEYIKTSPTDAYLIRPANRALVPVMNGWRVLDAGCGAGINLQWLLDNGAKEIVGVDISPSMLAIARREAPAEQVALHLADLEQPLDFLDDSSFDMVYSSMAIHYLEDLNRLFTEFARLLKPGGYLVFSTHHPYNDHKRFGGPYFETRLVTRTGQLGEKSYALPYYFRPLSAITEGLAQAGFLIERLTETKPTEEFRLADPEGYVKRMENASFLCARARKA
jgi:SAM-dependent methyltransferase